MKIALVTGASGDIGAQIVKKLVSDYCVLAQYCTDRKSVENLAKDLPTKVIPIFGDFSTVQGITDFAKNIADNYNVEVIINNAGVACQKLFCDCANNDIVSIMNINLLSAMIISRELSQKMVWQRSGCIVNISSIWGDVGASCEVAYSASKGGLIAFTKALAKELGQSNVRVNCITPGFIDTKMNNSFCEEDRQEFCQNIALGRCGKSEEVADVVAFFVSDKASYITGQVLGVNGGML